MQDLYAEHYRMLSQEISEGTSLVAQWLRLHVSTAGGLDSIPGQGTKIPHALQVWPKKKKKEINEHRYKSTVYCIYALEGSMY